MPRTKEFNADRALDAAMHLFWERGYAATSMQDLVDGMGINRFSIYDSFGDKRALFLAAVARYRAQVTDELIDILRDGPGLDAVRRYFCRLAEVLATPMGRAGCLVQNSTLELGARDPEVTAKLAETNRAVEEALYGALRRARRAGELGRPGSLRDRARYLFALAQGLIVIAKSGRDARAVRSAARCVLSELEGWRREFSARGASDARGLRAEGE